MILGIVCITSLTGCQEELTQEEVRSLIIENHSKGIGEVKITSIDHKRNEYIIKWKNEDNCESGIDYVHALTGEIKKGERTIC